MRFFWRLRIKCNKSGDGHLNTLKHCVAAELRYSNQLNRTKLGLDVILTSFLKSTEILLQSKILVLYDYYKQSKNYNIIL